MTTTVARCSNSGSEGGVDIQRTRDSSWRTSDAEPPSKTLPTAGLCFQHKRCGPTVAWHVRSPRPQNMTRHQFPLVQRETGVRSRSPSPHLAAGSLAHSFGPPCMWVALRSAIIITNPSASLHRIFSGLRHLVFRAPGSRWRCCIRHSRIDNR